MATKSLRRGKSGRRFSRTLALVPTERAREICLELEDNSAIYRSAVEFFGLQNAFRDPIAPSAKLLEQFEARNRSLLSLMEINLTQHFDGRDVYLRLESGNAVGAVPLFSPTSGMLDYGIVIQPRFAWKGIGPMLSEMGWRVTPTPLKLPLLKRSERKVPAWVISCLVLVRVKALLDALNRRFEITREILTAPRGSVNWGEYATKHVARGKFLSLPCTFPDLRDDRELVGAIRYALEKQRSALESQREQGNFVHQLIVFCSDLLRRVQHSPAVLPSPSTLASWLQRPLRTVHYIEGLQAIEWTVEDRGLAGMSDLEGIPWRMPMEQFFEAWVETVFQSVARLIGATLKTGRRRETVCPIDWEPPYSGSQKSLVPDVWLEWGSTTLIVDAKYKRHWDELRDSLWGSVEEAIREQHRNDLLQLLAYANLARSSQVVVCLAYPCAPNTWESMVSRNRVFRRAELNTGARSVTIWLTAIPMATSVDRVIGPILAQIQAEAA